MKTTTGLTGGCPVIMSTSGVVSSCHYLATEAGVAVLRSQGEWPSPAEAFVPGGEVLPIGSVWRQRDWGATFARLMAAERRFEKQGDGLRVPGEA